MPTHARVQNPVVHGVQSFAAQIEDKNYLRADVTKAPKRPLMQTCTTTVQVVHVRLERTHTTILQVREESVNNFS
jgi:hypothetical protein